MFSFVRPLPDVSVEMEAVQFFQMKLVKKEERWVPIRSLAGHLSQASEAVRECVGPQLEFRKWLLRHPHIFEVPQLTSNSVTELKKNLGNLLR